MQRLSGAWKKKDIKSTSKEESQQIARRLIKQGIRLEGVPGFYINREETGI